jgi:hypothetical protein
VHCGKNVPDAPKPAARLLHPRVVEPTKDSPGLTGGAAPETKVFLLLFLQKKKILVLLLVENIYVTAAGAPA